jgi:hypothetical protein
MVLTEDSGSGAYDTVLALVKEMFKQIDPYLQSQRIGFTPLADAVARRAMHGNLWKSTKPLNEPHKRLLVRSIINELLKEEGFVLYHIDGDCPWSAFGSSVNAQQFREAMLPPVQAGLMSRLGGEASEQRMARFLLLVPCYSIEAWLFQNTREAKRLCATEGCGTCLPQLTDWEENRASLDEVSQPKEALCLRDKYNAQLATSSYPAKEAFAANASFAATIMSLLECEPLTTALAKTHDMSGPASH